MSTWRLIFRGWQHHWRLHLAVLCGVAIASAVLTGALIVGDSVRGSLRYLALDRLQHVDFVLVSDRFFRAELADQLQQDPNFTREFSAVAPVSLLANVTVEQMNTVVSDEARGQRAAEVLLVGADSRFWEMGDEPRPQKLPGLNEIILNEPLAREIGADVGGRVVIRLPSAEQVPADSPLGNKNNRVRNVADLTVIEILPAVGLGRFRLRSSQQQPSNAFVNLATIEQALGQAGKVNALLVAATNQPVVLAAETPSKLRQLLPVEIDDFGITLQHVRRTYNPQSPDAQSPDAQSPNAEPIVVADFYQFTQDRLVWDGPTADAVRAAIEPGNRREIFTYLANSIEKTPSEAIPYSTIAAVDATTMEELLESAADAPSPTLTDDEIVLNSWAADDLGARVGDTVRVFFFEPETTHDQPQERQAEFRVAAIVPLTEPASGYRRNRPAVFASKPTLANDPELTPSVAGVTDEDSIANWDPPFPFDQSRVRDQDDTYWQNQRATPKAFISLAAGRRLWSSRFGDTTSFRVPASAAVTAAALEQAVERQLRKADQPFEFTPVKRQALAAATGTTSFEFLFLGFSMFLIASALMLVALLFRLGLELRAREIGILRAVGWSLAQVRKATLIEATGVAIAGAAIGTALGILFAWLMLVGLRTWWLAAIVTPFLNLHVNWWLSVPLGFVLGVLAGMFVIWLGVWRLRKTAPRQLLGGNMTSQVGASQVGDTRVRKRRNWRWLVGLLLILAAVSALSASGLQGEAQAGAFFGCGALVLMAALLGTASWLRDVGQYRESRPQLDLVRLAARAATRHPTRSALTTSLMAAACFLIIAISAFRLSPSAEGTGGFDWIMESGRPIQVDLTNPGARGRLLGADAERLAATTILPLRLQEGDDASCRNLYRPARPRILGVSSALTEYFDDHRGFNWSASAAESPQTIANPWRLLEVESNDGSIPVVLDKNTAVYSLKLDGGVGKEFELTYDRVGTVRFRVVGLLANSILQGSLLVAESQLLALFPNLSGYRMFLVATPEAAKNDVAELLETTFRDEGLDAKSTTAVLTDLLAVQNTYLSTFQSLGALGLLLGMIGMAIVQIRNVIERRSELALLRSLGFTLRRLGWMVLGENCFLLLVGLGIGVFAALLAVIPHVLSGGAEIPWNSLFASLFAIAVVGLLANSLAVTTTMRSPLIPALRDE